MKGIVFTEFFELVEEAFSIETSERLIDEVNLPSGCAYTTVGTYDYQEMVALVTQLSTLTGVPVPELLKTFGRHLLKRFVVAFPAFFEGMTSTFEFLPRVESYVHLEVKKLYPDAELPTFSFTFNGPRNMEMTYHSSRNLPDLAEGLILATFEHFGEDLELLRKPAPGDPQSVIFIISDAKIPT